MESILNYDYLLKKEIVSKWYGNLKWRNDIGFNGKAEEKYTLYESEAKRKLIKTMYGTI